MLPVIRPVHGAVVFEIVDIAVAVTVPSPLGPFVAEQRDELRRLVPSLHGLARHRPEFVGGFKKVVVIRRGGEIQKHFVLELMSCHSEFIRIVAIILTHGRRDLRVEPACVTIIVSRSADGFNNLTSIVPPPDGLPVFRLRDSNGHLTRCRVIAPSENTL